MCYVAIELPSANKGDITGGQGEVTQTQQDGIGTTLMNLLAAICGTTCKDTPLADMIQPSQGGRT